MNIENTTNSFTKKIGNTTFIVTLKQSETARKTLDEKIRELVIKEVMADGSLLTAMIQQPDKRNGGE